MTDINAQNVLVGSDAKVFLNGEEIGTWTECTLTTTYDYDDVYIGRDKDRQATGRESTGTLNHQATNSLTAKLYQDLLFTDAGADALAYIRGRGFSDDMINIIAKILILCSLIRIFAR